MTAIVSEIFDIRYGHSLELNGLVQTSLDNGIAFISRKAGDNGISAYVEAVDDLEPAKAGEISCALSGNGVLTTCLQERPFYTGYHVAILRPKQTMSKAEILFYCLCIKSNRYRYSYGRQANKTLGRLIVPSPNELPEWVNSSNLEPFEDAKSAISAGMPETAPHEIWSDFRYDEIFDIERGKGPRKATLTSHGATPFISSTDSNNGLTGYTSEKPRHSGNVITVNRNGSVGEAFYQPIPFSSTEDVHVFKPKFDMNKYIGIFLATLIRQEKYRFNYGRKWGLGRMNESIIRLPVTTDGQPDWDFMERYVKALPYSVSL
ncbi:MAG: hypothetical protein HEQ34_08250 [Sphingorhabdus sp.]|jgi:hypothetical protein|uniref:restriction endonuclease subunit S n=1 Tax=Sphingorhabdus sp. TaxID=1902408 RepID=UPI0025F9D776|nr:restriction endonuclease subunit S [Sphingorhabdus sp.]MCO4091927.1 hypothetical protein [Sphingorhabdus sp.]